MMAARNQAAPGGTGRARLDAIVTLNFEQPVGVVPNDIACVAGGTDNLATSLPSIGTAAELLVIHGRVRQASTNPEHWSDVFLPSIRVCCRSGSHAFPAELAMAFIAATNCTKVSSSFVVFAPDGNARLPKCSANATLASFPGR